MVRPPGADILPRILGSWHKTRNIAGTHGSAVIGDENNQSVVEPKTKVWELYDMEADRCEDNNLAAEMPDKVAEMSRMYDEWAARADVLPWDEVRKHTNAAAKHIDDLTKIFREK